MCGIAGIISSDASLNSHQARNTLLTMQAALAHRGPDGQGTYFSPSGTAALCHTRLSIIDLSDAGQQPMLIEQNRFAITYNGEIYNYQALRSELEQQGDSFTSHSDTEVILRLYARYGASCVSKLRGMFAFLIWDEQEQQAFSARDPLGIKPLYYCVDPAHMPQGSLAVASELRSLIKAKLHHDGLSDVGLESYFQNGTVAEPNTLLSSIQMLPAGHTLTWQAKQSNTKAYWRLSFTPKSLTRDEAISLTREALDSSVEAHFVSDVPVGIFLSGGIDSSALLALASKAAKYTLNTYSIAFESHEWNEGDIARRVADHFGSNHTEFLLTPERAKPLFDEFLSAVDQPTIDGFNTFCVSKLARQAGEKVVISGVGGDELFAGYKSFTTLPVMLLWSRWLAPLSYLLTPLKHRLTRWLPSKALRTLDFLQHPRSLAAAHKSLRGIFSVNEARALLPVFSTQYGRDTAPLEARHENRTGVPLLSNISEADQISQLELETYMRNQLLRDSDVMSMACGLELRVPFVDQQLVDTLTQIPAKYRLEPGKKLLIDAVPELPEWVVNRPKQGFRFPFDEWFSNQWNDLPSAPDSPSWLKLTPWYRRWSLLVLNDWLHRHVNRRVKQDESQ